MESEKGKLTKNREWNVDYLGMRGGGIGQMLFKGTNLQLVYQPEDK